MSRERDRSRSRSRSADRDMLEICWKPVKDDPSNFDAWTHLLQCIEQMDETRPAREAYDEFLKKYPYCYGYWRKYAEMERRHKHYERAIDVYGRGMAAIPLSIDLWLSYLAFMKDYNKDRDGKEHKIRHVYEKAITAAGLEFRSDKLWEDYISWEIKQNNLINATALYDRLLKVPTQLYSHHFDRFQELVNKNLPEKILSDEEYDKTYKYVESELKDKNVDIYVVEEVTVTDGAENLAENGPDKAIKKEMTTEYRRKYNDEALKLFRIETLEMRRKMHLFTEQEVSKRWQYEEGIKRPYFHVKPLERAQLKNWRAYLDFEMSVGMHERILILFERCMIACAMYEDMWLRYARYLESKGKIEEAREVYRRATEVHLPKKANPQLAASAFEEKQGNFDAARQILSDFDRKNPGFVLIQLRKIGVERRQALRGRDGPGQTDFAPVSARYEKLIRDVRTPAKMASFYALKFARFHAKIRGDRRLAEKIIKDALNRDKDNPQLFLQLIDLAYAAEPFNEGAVLEAFDTALRSGELSDSEKVRFSQRKLEFLEDLGTDITVLQDHFEYHTKLYKSVVGSATKRKAPEIRPLLNEKRVREDGIMGRHPEAGVLPMQPSLVPTGTPQQLTFNPTQQPFYHQQPVMTFQPMAAPQQIVPTTYNQYGSYYYPPPHPQQY